LKCASYCPHNQFRFDWDENNNLQRVLACNAEPEKGLREIGRTPMDDRDTEFECCIPLQLLQKTVLTALRKAQALLSFAENECHRLIGQPGALEKLKLKFSKAPESRTDWIGKYIEQCRKDGVWK
jgi:hypothetical protein